MKALFWFLLIVVAVLAGAVIFNFTRERTKQAGVIIFEIGADTIKAYEERIAELENKVEQIRKRMETANPLLRLQLQRQLPALEATIRDLKVAVAQWRTEKRGRFSGDVYRQCILLYGKASGVCDLLLSDSLSPDKPR